MILSALAFGLALFALTQRRLLWGVLGVGAHSLTLAGLYLALSAPDVALTEAAVGFGLVTLIYLLALRRTGKLVVAACPLYPLLYQEGERVAGLEWEILERFARWCHRDVEILWVSRQEIPRLLQTGEAHVGAGGFLPAPEDKALFSRPIVSTKLVCLKLNDGPLGAIAGEPGQELASVTYEDAAELAHALVRGEIGGAVVDLLRQREWQLHRFISDVSDTTISEEKWFTFAVAPDEEELWKSLEEFLDMLEKTGVLEELRRRYLG